MAPTIEHCSSWGLARTKYRDLVTFLLLLNTLLLKQDRIPLATLAVLLPSIHPAVHQHPQTQVHWAAFQLRCCLTLF